MAALVRAFAASHSGRTLGQQDVDALRRALVAARGKSPPDSALVDRLLDAGATVHRAIGGIPPEIAAMPRTRSRAEARESLLALASRYAAAREAGDEVCVADCRRAVIRGKDRLRRTLRSPNLSADKRIEKEELLSWYLNWLENPVLFESWLDIRWDASETASAEETPEVLDT